MKPRTKTFVMATLICGVSAILACMYYDYIRRDWMSLFNNTIWLGILGLEFFLLRVLKMKNHLMQLFDAENDRLREIILEIVTEMDKSKSAEWRERVLTKLEKAGEDLKESEK